MHDSKALESPQIRARTAIVFDTEYTAWEGSMARRWLAPGEFRELVQIGALKLDAATFEPLANFMVLIKPRLNPVLSPYFTALTGITNTMVAASGVDCAEAYNAFVAFCDGAPICAFGRDDHVLRDNLALYGIKGAPPLPPHVNAADTLRAAGIDIRGAHACDIARLCGVAFDGRAHDALADAQSIALGLKALVERGVRNPFAEFSS
jgi:inhibitor of KinA sporulation pathway (predicted exonuclease)